jgi:hypothetical protein
MAGSVINISESSFEKSANATFDESMQSAGAGDKQIEKGKGNWRIDHSKNLLPAGPSCSSEMLMTSRLAPGTCRPILIRFRIPDGDHVDRSLAPYAVVSEDFVGGSQHFRSGEHKGFSSATIELDIDEFVSGVAKELH